MVSALFFLLRCAVLCFVEAFLFHVFECLFWHKMSHVLSLADTVSDKSGRDLYDRGFQYRDRGMIAEFTAIVTFTGEDKEFVIVQYLLIFPPLREVLQTVHPADEDKLAIVVLL